VNQEELKLNGTHLLLAYADDVITVAGSIYSIKKSTEALKDASKEVVLEENPEKTKCVFMSHYQKPGQKHSIR
jgi:hypothetical protein